MSARVGPWDEAADEPRHVRRRAERHHRPHPVVLRRGAQRRRAGLPRPAVLLVLVFVTGCYTFQPVVGHRIDPGTRIRIHLSDEGSARISGQVGQPVSSLDGRVVSVRSDTLLVTVAWGGLYAGTPFEGRRDTLAINHEEIFRMERSRFSAGRTTLLGLGLVGLGALVIDWLAGDGGASAEPPTGDDGV